MKKINAIGERAEYCFEHLETKERVYEYSTDVDYNERFLDGNDNPPTKDGHKFISASRITHFDTSDGFIHEDEYADLPDDKVIFRVKDKHCLNVHKEDVEKIKQSVDGKGIKLKGGHSIDLPDHFLQKVKTISQ